MNACESPKRTRSFLLEAVPTRQTLLWVVEVESRAMQGGGIRYWRGKSLIVAIGA